MNAAADQPDSLDELPDELRAAVDHLKRRAVPADALQRALERAARVATPVPRIIPTSNWRSNRRLAQKVLLGLAAAVAACVVLGLWLSRPTDLWGDVVKAVQAKPWIHGAFRGTKPGQSREFWLSTSRSIGAARSAEQISFFDERLGINDRYRPDEKILYRLPTSTAELAQGQELLEIFQQLFRGDAELKTGFAGLILKDQRRRQTEKAGRKWDEYELHFRIPAQPDANVRMTFVVDGQTRLPDSMMMKGSAGESRECTFDYPVQGPADIYALGVPRDARLVDRLPTADMSRILAAMQAGRDRFDDFHAIVIRGGSGDSLSGPGQPIPMAYLVWKKGNRWRIEIGIVPPQYVRDPVPQQQDRKAQVQAACKQSYFTAMNVCDGKTVYSGEIVKQGGKPFDVKGTADQAPWLCQNAMHAMPTSWCYPLSFNAPNDRTEETVNLKPTEGPPNTILVTSRVLHPRANEIPFVLFWLDPHRGYAVVRRDMPQTDPAKPRTDRDVEDLMDQWQQTPNGIWYPTRVNAGSLIRKTWYHFFLEFPTDMPDELFQPAKRSVLTDRYPVGS